MHEFSKGKFALEARAPVSRFKVVNTDSSPHYLSLERMIASPQKMYPDAEVSIEGPPSTTANSTVKALFHKAPFSWQVNIMAELYVGEVPPGESTITIRTLEQSEWPFRIVGIDLSKHEQGLQQMFEYERHPDQYA
jgi:hypothetical protein